MVSQELLFDSEYYFNLYPDVKTAVDNGIFVNAYDHYLKHGKREGRQAKFRDELDYFLENNTDGWQNHLTLKGYVAPEKKEVFLNMENVPIEFKPVQNVVYPEGNALPFERYFEKKFNETKPNTFRTYLPIHWTAYYVNHAYGSDVSAKKYLQSYIDTLDKSKKYFTIIQYDDGILNDVLGLDILVYSMGCKKPGYYPLPLISQPINNKPQKISLNEKDILFSFFGANTHPIREQLVKELDSEFVQLQTINIHKYYQYLKQSIFALCPRGYGITSFRLFESMAFCCIPVYISDDFWEPFNIPMSEYCIKIYPDQIKDLPEMLKSVDIDKYQSNVKYYYENYFVYSQSFRTIIDTLTT
jgi:hypothetical protein